MIENDNMVFRFANDNSRNQHKAFRLPRISNSSLPPAADFEGYIAYDETNNIVVFSEGTTWAEIGANE